MSIRSFAVFEDLPVTPVKSEGAVVIATKAPSNPLGLSARSTLQENVPRLERSASLPVIEKENVNPVTGLSSSQPLSKKRKVSVSSENGTPCVLATKVLAVAEEPMKAKLRKMSAGSSGKVKGKASGMTRSKSTTDGRRVLGSSANILASSSGAGPVLATAAKPRRMTRSLSQPSILPRASSLALASVPEDEHFDTIHEDDEINQAVIDSRCRELTVKPLADLSTAYLQSGESTREALNEMEGRSIKETNVFISRMGDFGTPSSSYASISTSSSASSILTPSSSQSETTFTVFCDNDLPGSLNLNTVANSYSGVNTPVTLSTPERKNLYALFTFSSPVQSPERKH